jgi:hypothetical protein
MRENSQLIADLRTKILTIQNEGYEAKQLLQSSAARDWMTDAMEILKEINRLAWSLDAVINHARDYPK